MKTLWIVTHKMTGGGCERVIAQLLKRFTADGLICTLVTECSVPSFYPLPKAVRTLALLDKADMGMRDVPQAYRRLRKMVLAERPDMVLAMPEKVNVWAVLALLGTGVPAVVSERNDPRRHPENRLKRALRRLVYPLAAGFIFQTRQAADYFAPAIRARGVVLANPLDCAELPAPCIPTDSRVIAGAGRLHPQKNFLLLIAAFARLYETHPDWRLVIYGEGDERNKLEARASALPNGAVTLPGQTDALARALSSCGMFVLSSDYEGMPNALIEAMAMGLPCVATDCPAGGCAALIDDGKNGLLVPVGDEEALLMAMRRIADGGEGALQTPSLERAQAIRAALDERVICEKWRRYLERIAAK